MTKPSKAWNRNFTFLPIIAISPYTKNYKKVTFSKSHICFEVQIKSFFDWWRDYDIPPMHWIDEKMFIQLSKPVQLVNQELYFIDCNISKREINRMPLYGITHKIYANWGEEL